jgi:FkbM family methyltransferase
LGFDLIRYPYTERIFEELADILPRLGINCVLDVGAHHGEYATALRQIGYSGRVVSFEPDPASMVVLEAAAADDPGWQVRPFALGRQPARRTLNVAERSVQSSFWELHAGARLERRIEVDVRRLDEIVLGECVSGIAHPRVFLKLDVQGFELEILEGAREVLTRLVLLQAEVAPEGIYAGAPAARDVFGFAQRAGFQLAGVYALARDRAQAMTEADCLWVRPVVSV